MSLTYDLAQAGLSWSLANSTNKTARGTFLNCLEATVVLEDGTSFSEKFNIFSEYGPQDLLAAVFRKHAPRHPVYRKWLHSRGAYRVRLTEGALENLAELVHTALRKLADSKQSVITWNAIHYLHPSDWSELLAALRKALAEFMAKKRTHAQVGLKVRETILEMLETLQYAAPKDKRGRETKRNEHQTFALRAFAAACELTERDEWVFGWAGYLVEELEEPAQETAAVSAEAPAAGQ